MRFTCFLALSVRVLVGNEGLEKKMDSGLRVGNGSTEKNMETALLLGVYRLAMLGTPSVKQVSGLAHKP